MSLVSELRRRNVFRVAAAYLVVGWLLTEVLTTILPELGAPDWAARAVILIFAFGFAPAVVLAWFYEVTPGGIKREEDVDRDDPGQRLATRRVDQVTIATAIVLIIVVGLFSARYTADDGGPGADAVSAMSIAVLPFVNMSGDRDNEYFSDGLTETLLHMLAQIPDLQVAARTSSFAFKGQNKPVKEIAASLEVAHVLEGSVQRAGDQVRITAQLIRASDGFHIWSEVYDKTLDDIFAIQDEIAGEVGKALSRSLLGVDDTVPLVAGVTTTDPDAYLLYLQARRERATYSYGGLQAAEDLLKGALLIDPEFSDAKSELANSYIHQLETGLMDRRTAFAEIIAITDQVLAERPDDAIARATSIYAKALELSAQGDQQAIPNLAVELEAIIRRSPATHEPRILLVRAYTMLQRDAESVPVLEAALAKDKFNPALLYELGTAHLRLENWEEARAALERSLEFEAKQPNAYTYLGLIALQSGDGITFAKQMMNAIAVDPRDHELPGVMAEFLYQLGLVEIADDFRQRVVALSPTSAIAYKLELFRAKAVGDEAAGTEAARRAVIDDIDNRRFAFGSAVQYLVRKAVRDDRIGEELAWLDQQSPGIFDVDNDELPLKQREVRGVAFDAWVNVLPRNELARRLDVLIEFTRSFGIEPTSDPDTHVAILVLRDEIAAAIELALNEVFSDPVAMHMNWRETYTQPHYAEVAADPRIQQAIRRWEADEAALRADVEAYFADLQAAR
ncbi:MAG: hypothetical protein QNJ11_08415 [Woeseiaceae bacterium]|nr:hypothetical protein [Woeseiaceae bacterium]